MSQESPWIALSIDWQDSEMFDDANHGVRLAWICLLCLAKSKGRAGKVRFRGKVFAENYRLSMDSVEAMVAKATSFGAVTVNGDLVTVVNWKRYQDPRVRSNGAEDSQSVEVTTNGIRFSKSAENDATTHHPPPTKPPLKKRPAGLDDPEFQKFWESFPPGRRQDRADAYKAWREAVKIESPEVLIAAAAEYAASEKGRGEFVKAPATWLRKTGWHDDREAWKDRSKAADVKPPEFREIPYHVFLEHFKAGDFLIRPKTDPPLADGRQRVWGQLKGLRKVESYKENGATP